MKFLYTIILMTISSTSIAQNIINRNENAVIIEGKLSKPLLSMVEKAPFIEYYDDYNYQFPAFKHLIPLNLNGGTFHVTIKPKGQVGYFNISGGGILISPTNDMFLIEKGDSIHLDLTSKFEAQISGHGSEKIYYQNSIGKHLRSMPTEWRNNNMDGLISFQKSQFVKSMATSLYELDRDTLIKKQEIKNLIRLNIASAISKRYLNTILNVSYFSDTSYYKAIKNEVNFLITQANGFVERDPDLISNSFMYVQYLLELNQAVVKIRTKSDVIPVNIIYKNFKAEYSGVLKDKLLAYCFLGMLKKDPLAVNLLDDAKLTIKDSVSREILIQVENAKSVGKKAFDFHLESLEHKMLNLADYKGKVIILDTYYAGCFGCRDLAIKMEPIADYFKNNKNVVFIGFDGVAKTFDAFERGAKSKKYGAKQTVYAWSGGIGPQHPMLLYYQYFSFPNLLIIGKNGEVISANPERPVDKASQLRFIGMVNQNL